ncbi:unnamed protein product [Coregonus sp. 'balchen']|nr:unnamed protein product [Coregonus sp. 'balchen']
MESSDEEEGRTFVQVVSEKYNPENFPYCRGNGMGVVVLSNRLNLPSVLVLDGCGISKAGDETEVATFCAHVVELDLSHNQLQDWGEICTIVSNIPNLDFLNLSMNPLSGIELEPGLAEVFFRVRRLVLINTRVTWDTVHTLTRQTPELEELFLCLNEYDQVAESQVPCPSLRLLQITDNQLQEWGEVRKFGPMYPGLHNLVLSNNKLGSVEEDTPRDTLQHLFPNLRSINLNNSVFLPFSPVLTTPLLLYLSLSPLPDREPFENQLPSVSVLNGSVVTEGEREDAERFFIRHYLDIPEEMLPHRYHVLVSKYGRLAPLAEVDLRPRCMAMLDVRWGERKETLSLRLEQTVGELKKELRALVGLPANGMRLYYIARELGSALGPEEMKYGSRALHSYMIQDGDEILVVPKTKSRTISSTSLDS